MATTELEKLVLGALNINDWVNFELTSLTFNPAQKRPQFATNADADGEALVRESHYTSASFDLQIRVIPQSTADAGRAKLGELIDAVQACEKVEGGQALGWTPNNSETVYTAYVLTGDATELPIEVTGDNAGWLLKGAWSPVVKIHLTCRPFLYTPERVVLAATESGAEPLQVVYVKGIKGDVPAEARLIVKDTAAQDRRFAMWGRDVVVSETNPSLLLSAKSGLTGSGFSGVAKTRTGAYLEEKVLRGNAVSQPTTLCGTGRIENVGTYAVFARVYATSEASRFRLSYRNGDGPLIPLEWKEASVVNGWDEIYMGTVAFDAVQSGTQTSEIRLDQRATVGNPANDANFLRLHPTGKGSGIARGIASLRVPSLVTADPFASTSGALSGRVPVFGSAWSGAGDGVDFTAEPTASIGIEGASMTGFAKRSEVSDANLNTGRYGISGATNLGTSFVSAQVGATVLNTNLRIGVFLRYSSVENWLMAALTMSTGGHLVLVVIKRIAGVVTPLDESGPLTGTAAISPRTVTLKALANGEWTATVGSAAILAGRDSSLTGGGSLAEGKPGIYDAWTAATANTRIINNFEALSGDAPYRVCYSGRTIEFTSRECLRLDSTGIYSGPASSYRGGGFFLEPENKLGLGLSNRVVVLMRRNDNTVEEDSTVSDKQTVEARAKERFLAPR